MNVIHIHRIDNVSWDQAGHYYVNNGNDVMVSIGACSQFTGSGRPDTDITPYITYDNLLWFTLPTVTLRGALEPPYGVNISDGLYGIRGIRLYPSTTQLIELIVCESFVPIRTSAIGNAPNL